MKKDMLIIYKNYLHTLIWAKEFKNIYNDEDMLTILEKEFDDAKILIKKFKHSNQGNNFSER